MPRGLCHAPRVHLKYVIAPRNNENGKPPIERLKRGECTIHTADPESAAHEENRRQIPIQPRLLLRLAS